MTNIVTCSEILRYYYCHYKYLEEHVYLKIYHKHIKKDISIRQSLNKVQILATNNQTYVCSFLNTPLLACEHVDIIVHIINNRLT